MYLSYDGIEFQMLRVEEWTTEEVYDPSNVDYVCDRHQITCYCILNRDLNDKRRFPKSSNILPGTMDNIAGNGPAIAVPEIETRLRNMRRKLAVYSYTNPSQPNELNIMLEAPKNGYRTDAKWGPQCIGFQVIPIGGFSSYGFRLQFVTWINKCDPGIDKPPVTGNTPPVDDDDNSNIFSKLILSNRWSMYMTTTDDYFPTQITTGLAIVRMDDMVRLGIDARDLINNISYLPAAGWRRLPVEIEVVPGGDQINYTISDQYQASNFIGGVPHKATRAEVLETRMYSRPGVPLEELAKKVTGGIRGEMEKLWNWATGLFS